MNCIFICVFNQDKYVDMFYLLLESLYIYGNIHDDTHILVYTSTLFMNMIKQSHLYNEKIIFEINDEYNNVELSCCARLDLFYLPSIVNYEKVLYLDTDILIKGNINTIFDIIQNDIMYTLKEGTIDSETEFWGNCLFGDEIDNYSDKSAFTSGILLFNNCAKIKFLFDEIKKHMNSCEIKFGCVDQPYVIYNSFKYNAFDNKVLTLFAVNNDNDIHSDKIIHHFPGGPGEYGNKIEKMSVFLNELKDYTICININKTKKYISENLLPIIENCGELLEGNIFMTHHSGVFSDVFLNKSKNISNLLLNKNIKKVMDIGFNSGFSCLLMLFSNPTVTIDCLDVCEHLYTNPCYEKIKETFGDRVNLIIGDSTKTLLDINNTYDLIHIDGGHSTPVVICDIENSYRLSKKGTILIMDDYDFNNLHDLWDNYIYKYALKPLDINIYPTPHHDIKFINYEINSVIPKIIMQTSITKMDSHVVDKINFFSPNYKYIHFVDSEIIDFFTQNPSEEFPNLVEKFKSFTKGQHSTQLFRYYFLYLNGGIFIDSDAIFETNVNKIIQNYSFVSVKTFMNNPYLFDGFIATCPKNEVIYEILKHTYFYTDNSMVLKNYHYLCEQIFNIYNSLKLPNTKIYQEYNKIDEGYGGSVILDDNNNKLLSHFWLTKIIPDYKYYTLINKTYTWENSFITFLSNFEMDAFGKGNYHFIDDYNIIAIFGYRKHNISFNKDYTEFSSKRMGDSYIVNGTLINKF